MDHLERWDKEEIKQERGLSSKISLHYSQYVGINIFGRTLKNILTIGAHIH